MTRESTLHGILVVVLTAVVGYLAWQIDLLAVRLDALERESVTTREKLAADGERLLDEIGQLRGATAARGASVPSAAASAEGSSPVEARAPAAERSAGDVTVSDLQFLETHLAPGDADIAKRLYLGAPLDSISRQVNRSRGFVIMRAGQIEHALSTQPTTRPELLAKIRASLVRIRAPR